MLRNSGFTPQFVSARLKLPMSKSSAEMGGFMEEYFQVFKKGLEDLNIFLEEEQFRQFQDFYALLMEKNKVMNLTAITEPDEVIRKHFLDSLSLNLVYDLKSDIRILDLGTGAGFPGIPLKIAYPQLRLVLADSLQKRIRFLDEVIEKMGFEEIGTVHARAEEIGRDREYREQFDLCVSRAVANLSSLSEYCLPLVNVGGMFISYKSGEIEDEAEQAKKAVSVLGGEIEKIYKFDLYGQKRSFVLIRKKKKTPKGYPRKAGTPTKSPL